MLTHLNNRSCPSVGPPITVELKILIILLLILKHLRAQEGVVNEACTALTSQALLKVILAMLSSQSLMCVSVVCHFVPICVMQYCVILRFTGF